MDWLHKQLTGDVLGICFEVMGELGAGFVESVYEKALLVSLHEKGIKAEAQVPLRITFHGMNIGDFVADIVVEDKLIIELKAVKALTSDHQAQLINYLKATGKDVGLLVNFGNPRLEYKRTYRPGLS